MENNLNLFQPYRMRVIVMTFAFVSLVLAYTGRTKEWHGCYYEDTELILSCEPGEVITLLQNLTVMVRDECWVNSTCCEDDRHECVEETSTVNPERWLALLSLCENMHNCTTGVEQVTTGGCFSLLEPSNLEIITYSCVSPAQITSEPPAMTSSEPGEMTSSQLVSTTASYSTSPPDVSTTAAYSTSPPGVSTSSYRTTLQTSLTSEWVSNTTDDHLPEDEGGINKALVISVVVLAFICVLLIVTCSLVYWYRRKRRAKTHDTNNNENPDIQSRPASDPVYVNVAMTQYQQLSEEDRVKNAAPHRYQGLYKNKVDTPDCKTGSMAYDEVFVSGDFNNETSQRVEQNGAHTYANVSDSYTNHSENAVNDDHLYTNDVKTGDEDSDLYENNLNNDNDPGLYENVDR